MFSTYILISILCLVWILGADLAVSAFILVTKAPADKFTIVLIYLFWPLFQITGTFRRLGD